MALLEEILIHAVGRKRLRNEGLTCGSPFRHAGIVCHPERDRAVDQSRSEITPSGHFERMQQSISGIDTEAKPEAEYAI